MQRMLMKIAHHKDMVRAKPIAQIQMSRAGALMLPSTWGCQIAGYPRMYSSCSTLHTLLTASIFLRDSWDPTALAN